MCKTDELRHSITPNVASIPSNYSRLIARVLGLREQDISKLLALTNLSTEEFVKEDTLLTAQQQIQILENALDISQDSAFGLKLGEQLTPPTHGAMGFLANSSPNLLTALDAFKTYSPTRMNFTRIEVQAFEHDLEINYEVELAVSNAALKCLYEASAKTFFECAEFIIGRPLTEAKTFLPFPEPPYSKLYKDYFPGQVNCSSSRFRIVIPISTCRIPNVSANHENYSIALKQCQNMLEKLNASKDSSTYQIQKMMLSHPPGILDEEQAAAALFISKRTLARRLKKEGTGFRQIRDDLLSQQAMGYLRDSKLSVDATAALLNYHDSSNFRRAFKRWFKLSPDQFRQSLKQQSS